MTKTLRIPKPEFGGRCNGCGICCLRETCALGIDIHGHTDGPCPSLTWRDGRFWCGLAEESPLVAFLLGVGFGCDSDVPEGTVAGGPDMTVEVIC